MKRVLLITYSLDHGGQERMVVKLANGLDPQRYEASVCCVAHRGVLAPLVARQDGLFDIGNEGRVSWRAMKEIVRLIRRLRIDVVHTHNTPGLLYGLVPAKLCRKPVIHTNHGYVYTEKQHPIVSAAETLIGRRADRYVCVSKHLAEQVSGSRRVPAPRLSVVYNGVDLPALDTAAAAQPGRELVIGSVGNLRAIKNYQLLIAAFAEIAGHFECRLELVGDGNERDRLVEQCARLGVADRVQFVGHVSDPSLYLKRFDVFVLPSLSEGVSVSVLEALAMKRLCLVSDVGGNPEIIQDGVNGFLFKSNDHADLVRRLTRLLRDVDEPSLRSVRDRGRATVEQRFSLDSMIHAYAELYDAVVRS